MIDFPMGESWEVFQIEGHKAGVLRRVTTPADEGLIKTTLSIIYGQVNFRHEFKFNSQPSYRPASYLYDTNDGAPVYVEFKDGQMVCQIDEEKFVEDIPADARPAYGNFPLIVTIPFEKDFIASYTQIDDGSCTILGEAELVSTGWEEKIVNQQLCKLWRVDEFLNGQEGNRYWLDEARRLKLTHWKGAVSYQVETQAEAIDQLPNRLRATVKTALGTADQSDWTDEISSWLNGPK